MDEVSLTFVRNLAIADIIYTLLVILPITVTYMTGKYILGKIYCFVNAQLNFIPGSVNILTSMVITLVEFPRAAGPREYRPGPQYRTG